MYQQFESTDKAKKSLSDLDLESKVSNSVSKDATYYSSLEGNYDGTNSVEGCWQPNITMDAIKKSALVLAQFVGELVVGAKNGLTTPIIVIDLRETDYSQEEVLINN
jgi:hypothetical protein